MYPENKIYPCSECGFEWGTKKFAEDCAEYDRNIVEDERNRGKTCPR